MVSGGDVASLGLWGGLGFGEGAARARGTPPGKGERGARRWGWAGKGSGERCFGVGGAQPAGCWVWGQILSLGGGRTGAVNVFGAELGARLAPMGARAAPAREPSGRG